MAFSGTKFPRIEQKSTNGPNIVLWNYGPNPCGGSILMNNDIDTLFDINKRRTRKEIPANWFLS